MQFAQDMCGAAPVIKRFQVGETMSIAGVPVVVGGANNEGIALASTTAAVTMIGVTIDTATILTAQQTGNADPAAYVSVIVNPLAIYRAKLSGGSTANTALTQYDVTTASTDGLTVTTGDEWSSPSYDEGVVFGYDGANAGVGRKITSVSSTAATVIVAFPNDTVVGDNFIRVPFCTSPYGQEKQFVQLTTTLDQVDASVAVDTNNVNFVPYELELRDESESGVTNSFVLLRPYDHLFGGGAIA